MQHITKWHSRPQHSSAQRSAAHKMAVCGAAVPSTVRMEPGLLTSWRICKDKGMVNLWTQNKDVALR